MVTKLKCVAVILISFQICSRGALISKLTDIPITDISAIKNTDTDANTDIAAPFNYDIFIIQMANHWWSTTFIYLLHMPIYGISV